MMPRGQKTERPDHNAIELQNNANWHIIPSIPEDREKVREIQRSKYSAEKVCCICGQKFDYGYISMQSCKACKIIVPCSICGKEFELDLARFSGSDLARINSALFGGQNIISQCSKECKFKAVSIGNRLYHDKHPDEAMQRVQRSISIKFCEKCNAETEAFQIESKIAKEYHLFQS